MEDGGGEGGEDQVRFPLAAGLGGGGSPNAGLRRRGRARSGAAGWGRGLFLTQLSPSTRVRSCVGSRVTRARAPGARGRGWGGWSAAPEHGSNADRVRVSSARVLPRSGGGGGSGAGGGVRRPGRSGAAGRGPLARARSCLGQDPYLPRGSNGVAPQHQEPRSRALACCCQHSSSDHPAPFLCTPPAAGQPAHAPTPSARPLSQQKPCPPGPQCACDSAGVRAAARGGGEGGGGLFSFPPDSPSLPCLGLQERGLAPTQRAAPGSPHLCSSALPLRRSSPRVVWNPLCPGSAA